jgi:hypothetical protein
MEARVLHQKTKAENTMAREAVPYISDRETFSGSIFAGLEAAGYEVVSTRSFTQAMAMEYITHSVVAVVLHHWTVEQSSLDAAKSPRAFCPNAPIILLCADQLHPLPAFRRADREIALRLHRCG